MLRISRITDYATVVMAYLALHPTEIQNAKDINLHTHIALPTVSKILKLLAKANLVISHRGVNGGYSLAESPDKIFITQIIEAIEGTMGLTACAHLKGECQIESYCAIRGNWRSISEMILNALQEVRLTELMNTPTQHEVSFKPFLTKSPRSQEGRRHE